MLERIELIKISQVLEDKLRYYEERKEAIEQWIYDEDKKVRQIEQYDCWINHITQIIDKVENMIETYSDINQA